METLLTKMFCRLFLLYLIVEFYQVECANSSTHFKLYSDLMENYNSPYIRPMTDDEHAVSVGFRFAPVITLLDEANQRLEVRGMLLVTWVDNRLTWNPADYADINETNIPLFKDGVQAPNIWRPEFILYESRENFQSVEIETNAASLSSNGEIHWYTLATTTSHCIVVVRYYPFDTQICDLSFTTWLYQTDEQIFYAVSDVLEDAIYKDYEVRNGLWEVRINHIHVGNASFRCKTCTGQEQSYVHYTLKLTRGEHWLYFYNLLFPCFVMSGMSMLVIWLPTKDVSGAAGLGLTCVLAFFVYMAFLFSELPATGLSLIGNYIVWLIAEGVLITFYSVHRANQKKHEQNKTSFVISEHNGKDNSTWRVTQFPVANEKEKTNAQKPQKIGFSEPPTKVSYSTNIDEGNNQIRFLDKKGMAITIAGVVSGASTTDGEERGEQSSNDERLMFQQSEMQDTDVDGKEYNCHMTDEEKKPLVESDKSECFRNYLTLKTAMIGMKALTTIAFVVILFLYIGL